MSIPSHDEPGYLLGLKLAPWWRRMLAGTINLSVFYAYLGLFSLLPHNYPSYGPWDWLALLSGLAVVFVWRIECPPGHYLMRLSPAIPVRDRDKGPTLAALTMRDAVVWLMLQPLNVIGFGWVRMGLNRYRQTWVDSRLGVIWYVNDRPWNEGYIAQDPEARGRRLA